MPDESGTTTPNPPMTSEEREQKIRQIIEQVQPYIQSHGGVIEFLSLEDGVVRLVLHGSCESCIMASVTLGAGIEQIVKDQVPGIEHVVAVDPQGKEISLVPFDDFREFQ